MVHLSSTGESLKKMGKRYKITYVVEYKITCAVYSIFLKKLFERVKENTRGWEPREQQTPR